MNEEDNTNITSNSHPRVMDGHEPPEPTKPPDGAQSNIAQMETSSGNTSMGNDMVSADASMHLDEIQFGSPHGEGPCGPQTDSHM